MRSILTALIVLFVSFPFSSCKKSNPVNSSSNGQVILPLKTGNNWVYRAINYDSAGTPQDTIFYALTIGKDTLIGNQTWYDWGNGMYMADESNGVWATVTGSSPIPPTLVFKFPANVGDNWVTHIFYTGDQEETLLSKDTLVSVPAGTFSCHEYRALMYMTPMQPIEDDYLAPNVGIIATDSYAWSSANVRYRSSRSELVSVALK